ncbi:hypothetical protein L917_07287 [Phytophthora nicotianae]|uniref:Uncharacterized protein n=1 Tax=Phytophthora nicotianae TaxID=4792 RepID=W2LBJ4_PHYNI|nr:hypothetical protein L917_07287 [Phytophthora nicotianae]
MHKVAGNGIEVEQKLPQQESSLTVKNVQKTLLSGLKLTNITTIPKLSKTLRG